MTEEFRVEDRRQQVIGMLTEARAWIEELAGQAREIRAREDLNPTRKQQALEEVTQAARTRISHVIRDARHHVSSGGAAGAMTGICNWDKDLSAEGLAARDAMLGYIDQAERVFEVDLEELATGEAPSAEAAAQREAAAAELASYEAAHHAPAGVIPARARWSTGG